MKTIVRGTTGVIVLAILVSSIPAHVSAEEGFADLLAGITWDNSLDEADITFLKSSLQLLHDQLPVWYAYLEQAKPLVLSVNPALSARGTAAYAECCNANGAGVIVLGYRFGAVAAFDEPGAQTIPARQVTFLGYLIHEATHVRDQRAGRLPKQMNPAVCVTGEKAALVQELDFKRALAITRVGEGASVMLQHQSAAQSQWQSQIGNLNDDRYWEQYCGNPFEPKLSNGVDFAFARINPTAQAPICPAQVIYKIVKHSNRITQTMLSGFLLGFRLSIKYSLLCRQG